MSGILHCEEEDYLTAFSYFLEAFETYDQGTDKRAVVCLKYMMLCKVLQGAPEVRVFACFWLNAGMSGRCVTLLPTLPLPLTTLPYHQPPPTPTHTP